MTRPAKINRPPIPTLVAPLGGTEGGDAIAPDPGDVLIWDGDSWVPGPSGGNGLGWCNVEDFGAVHDGTTDDTVAIQDAIDACFAAGGGTVFFPNGIYAIEGALQSTSTYNAQLTIPQNAFTGTAPPLAMRLLGAGPTAQSNNGAIGDWLPSTTGAILLSNWAGTITGDPAVISAGKVDALYPAASFNWLQITFENIEIRCQPNPKLSGIQMRAAVMLSCVNVTISTDTASDGMSLPSNTNAVGIDMPLGLNSNPPDLLQNVMVDGFYWGIRTSEQANGTSITVGHCTKGMRFTGNNGSPNYIRHANQFGKVLAVATPTVLVFDGDERWLSIDLLLVEHDSGAFPAFGEVYDIDDASNYARGFIGWHVTDYFTGPGDALLVNGGTGLSLHGFYAKRWKLTNVVDVPIGTNPSTNPANGRRLYTDSSTGHLSSLDSAGTVFDYEAAGSLTVQDEGTPLTTAATTLNFVGSGVVASGAGATKTITVGGGAGGIGEILISDTPSTPLIFADLIQNEAQNDLVYADP